MTLTQVDRVVKAARSYRGICAGCGKTLVKRPGEKPSHFARRQCCDIQCRTAALTGRTYRQDPQYLPDGRGCWIWQRSLNPNGYGELRFERKHHLAHRWLYEQEHGPLAAQFELHHRCGVRACVNPAHLEPLTRTDHQRLSPITKLTVDDVREIRASPLGNRKLAAKYGMSRSAILHAKSGRSWKDVA